MNYKHIFWGVILILLGALFFLRNFGVIDFHWGTILRLWPLLLILWGISLIPAHNAVKLGLSFVAVILTVFLVHKYDNGRYNPFRWIDRNHGDDWNGENRESSPSDTATWPGQEIMEPFDSAVESAVLRFDAAAGEFRLTETSENLIEFRKEGNIGNYNLTSRQVGESRILELSLNQARIRSGEHNRAIISLHPGPAWDFDFDIGAADIDMDLNPFKTREIQIDGGASSIKLTIGERQDTAKIDIDAGASSILVRIPHGSGCEIKTETVLSGKSLDGFNELSRSHYQTPGFEKSPRKVFVRLDAAISSLKVERY
jgi:hypothetical protein